jgi:hypothetical protein
MLCDELTSHMAEDMHCYTRILRPERDGNASLPPTTGSSSVMPQTIALPIRDMTSDESIYRFISQVRKTERRSETGVSCGQERVWTLVRPIRSRREAVANAAHSPPLSATLRHFSIDVTAPVAVDVRNSPRRRVRGRPRG